jgi:hypothetical protein
VTNATGDEDVGTVGSLRGDECRIYNMEDNMASRGDIAVGKKV